MNTDYKKKYINVFVADISEVTDTEVIMQMQPAFVYDKSGSSPITFFRNMCNVVQNSTFYSLKNLCLNKYLTK